MSVEVETIELKVHRVRFFVAELTSINFMSYNEDNQKLAVIRRRIRKYKSSQADTLSLIQIWNMRLKASFIEQTIYDDSDNPSLLESLVWGPKDRLFSCGLNSYINEYDLTNNRIKRSYNVASGPVWCMALDATKSLIAVGTEDGDVCVYRIEENVLQFNKMMDKNDTRILCLQWYKPEDNSSQLIITSSIDFIKIWNYQTGRCVDHIQVASNGVIIWCLKVLKDFTIISGDSRGTTSFWNGSTMTLINSYNSHKADILCLGVEANESKVYSSGVDPDIITYERTSNNFNSWVQSKTRKLHTHDVRALTLIEPNWLISGGIDSYLIKSSFKPNLELRYLSNYSSKAVIIRDYVLVQFETYVQIWKLGQTEEDFHQTDDSIEILPLAKCALKLADIKARKPIITASFNQFWIVYSNSDNIKVKNWSLNAIKKVPVLYEPIVGATQIAFCGLNFVAIVSGTVLFVLKLDILGVILQLRLDFEHRIHLMTANDKYLAICTADPKNMITIYSIETWNSLTSFPNHCLPTCFRMNELSSKSNLWIVYCDYKLNCYEIKCRRMVKSIKIKEHILPEVYQSIDEYWPIKEICFAAEAVLFSDDNNLFKLDTTTDKINKSNQYRHILKMSNIQDNELVVVELTPDMIFKFLPQCLAKKKFGV